MPKKASNKNEAPPTPSKPVLSVVQWECKGSVLVKIDGKVVQILNVTANVIEHDFDKTFHEISKLAIEDLMKRSQGGTSS